MDWVRKSTSEGQHRSDILEKILERAEMLWKCAEEVQWIYWYEKAQDGTTRQESKKKTRVEIH